MQDSNIPKFLSNDIPLFNDIIEDLFPGIVILERDNREIKNKLIKKCE
jgi:dynein heavy chain